MGSKTDFPTELVEPVKQFQTSIEKVTKVVDPLLSVCLPDQQESHHLIPIDKAKLDCLSASALNTLVWMWLRSKGENPKETELMVELERTKATMIKIKELQDRDKRHRVDKGAAKRFIKGGLYDHTESKTRKEK